MKFHAKFLYSIRTISPMTSKMENLSQRFILKKSLERRMRSLVFLSLFVSAVHQVIGQNVESESSLRRRPIRHSLPPPIEAPVIFPGTFKSKASPTTLSSKSGSDKFLTIPSELPKDHLLWPRPETQPEPSSVPQQLASSEAMQSMLPSMGADPLMQDPLFASMVGSMMGSGSESGFNSNNNI